LQRDDLLDMADQLDRLADSLSRDRHVVAKFNTRLQVLDIISQRLRAPD
jgi:predicted transcriptional regulator